MEISPLFTIRININYYYILQLLSVIFLGISTTQAEPTKNVHHFEDQLSEVESKPNSDWISYVAIDLYKYANRGHLQQVGPMLSPGAPGWGRHSKSTHLSGTFRKPELYKNKMVSWIEGRGGTIFFPVSEGEKSLDELLIWLHPIAPHQVVSIFVDEVLIKNLSLHSKGRYYRLKLPKPLQQGEHSLRLYFRFTRPASWGGRTPGAIGPLSFVPKGHKEQMLDQWTGEVIFQQQRWGALFAPPPSTWRFYFVPPKAAQFKTTVYIPPFGPGIEFQVYVASDNLAERCIVDERLSPSKNKQANSKPLSVDLKDYVGKPIRLTLKVKKTQDHPLAKRRANLAEKALLEVGWLAPRIESIYPSPRELPPVKRLLIWSIDGLKMDALFKHPELSAHLPSLSWFIDKGILFSRIWSDQSERISGHLMLLNPFKDHQSLLKTLKDNGGWSAYIGSTLADIPPTDIRFDSVEYVDPQELEDHPYRTILTQVQQMSKLGRIFEQRHVYQKEGVAELIYIHSPYETTRRHYPFDLTPTEKEWLQHFKLSSSEAQQWRENFSQLKEIDYGLAQLISELSIAEVETDTAILITGTRGMPWKLSTPTPKRFVQHIETSAILLHPALQQSATRIDRSNLSSVSDTLLAMLISSDHLPAPHKEQRGSLAPYILSQSSLPATVEHVRSGAHALIRMNDYYLLERPIGKPTLWKWSLENTIHPNAMIKDLSQSAPILLRTLRDGLSVSPLIEGLK